MHSVAPARALTHDLVTGPRRVIRASDHQPSVTVRDRDLNRRLPPRSPASDSPPTATRPPARRPGPDPQPPARLRVRLGPAESPGPAGSLARRTLNVLSPAARTG
eukprot:258321-Hanusia_phi.AAC.1